MNVLRITTVLLLAALSAACATTSPPPAGLAAQPWAEETVAVAPDANAENAVHALADTAAHDGTTTAAIAGDDTQTGDPASASDAEDDFAAIYGVAPYNPVADPNLPESVDLGRPYDPWEPMNRRIHTFNNAVDRTVARPLARAYVRVVPRPLRLGVSNFMDNLGQPLTAVNSLLQGQPKLAGQAMGRFLLNSTLGIGGILDPASDAGLPRKREDFGQSLGVWGWQRSRYVVLPFFGPRTIRDTVGLAGDVPLSPIRRINDDQTRILLQGLSLVDTRAQMLSLDSLREGAMDDYTLVRDAWLKRRNYQIESNRPHSPENEALPDYLLEEEANPTVPMDAIPIPSPAPA